MERYFMIGWVAHTQTGSLPGNFTWVDTEYPAKWKIDAEVFRRVRSCPQFSEATVCAVTMINEVSEEDYHSYTNEKVF